MLFAGRQGGTVAEAAHECLQDHTWAENNSTTATDTECCNLGDQLIVCFFVH